MIVFEDLNKWFNDLEKIIFDINISIENIKRLNNTKNDYEKHVMKHGFFSHFYRQSRFTVIVQLSKIYSNNKNQKRNLHKFFNILENETYDDLILKQFEKNKDDDRLFCCKNDVKKELVALRQDIDNNKDLIKRVVDLRDKIYAHTDEVTGLKNVTNEELELLIKLAIKIYNSLRGKFFDLSFMFNINGDWKIDYLITSLGKQQQEHFEKFGNKI